MLFNLLSPIVISIVIGIFSFFATTVMATGRWPWQNLHKYSFSISELTGPFLHIYSDIFKKTKLS